MLSKFILQGNTSRALPLVDLIWFDMAKGNIATRNAREGRTIPRYRFGLPLNQQAC